MHERNENQGNPEPTEREEEAAVTERKEEADAMQGAGHEDPQPPAQRGDDD